MHIPTAEMNLWSATVEEASTGSPIGRPPLELCAECVSAPSVTHCSEVEVGLSELVAGSSEDSTSSAAIPESALPAFMSPAAESQACPGAQGEASPSPELMDNPTVSPGFAEVSWGSALQPVPAREAKEDAPQTSPDASLENLPNVPSEISELQTERDLSRMITPPIVFVSGLVSLSIVLQEPITLFIIGLLLILHRL